MCVWLLLECFLTRLDGGGGLLFVCWNYNALCQHWIRLRETSRYKNICLTSSQARHMGVRTCCTSTLTLTKLTRSGKQLFHKDSPHYLGLWHNLWCTWIVLYVVDDVLFSFFFIMKMDDCTGLLLIMHWFWLVIWVPCCDCNHNAC